MATNTPPPSRAKTLLAYFLRHPKRQETLEEVIRWRVRQDIADVAIDEITEAIEWLEKEHYVVREHPSAGTTIIRLNNERIADAEQFLRDMATQPADIDSERSRSDDGTSSHSSRGLIRRAIAWIDATLLCQLRVHKQSIGEHPLTVHHDLVDALLVKRVWPAGEGPVDACEAAKTAESELRDALAEASTEDDPLAALARRLSLDFLEFQLVLLVLASELDAAYQLVFGVLNHDMARTTPTLGLLRQIVAPAPGGSEPFGPIQGLTRWRLLESGTTLPHADELLRVDTGIVEWVLGHPDALYDTPQLRSVGRREPWPGATWLQQPDDLTDIEALARCLPPPSWLLLAGEDSSGWRAIIEAAAGQARAELLRISVPAVGGTADPAETAVRLARMVLLLRAVPVLDVGDAEPESQTVDALELLISILTNAECRGVVVIPDLERSVAALPLESSDVWRRDRPDEATLSTAFAAAAADVGLYLCLQDARQLAHAFPLPLGSIDEAMRLAVLEGAAKLPRDGQTASLFSACRRIASPDLPRFARRVHPVFTLDDIVLPADRMAQLEEIIARVKYASQVLETWGFGAQLPYGRGVAALFSGKSGTGKTMAAQAIANALHTDTFVIDLSRIVDKFLGESEKRIDVAFRDAERAGAVLQVDEADVLFGKRTTVKDSHDFHANLQVGFILQRLETFSGVALLTTNFRQNLDQAFLRRLCCVVEFPEPNAEAREAIWRRCLPATAPVRSDINLQFLARRCEITGANIRSITLRAAFLAANERAEHIEMRHLIAATRSELLKLGMNATERELADVESAQRRSALVA